ncbi:NAD-dependent epimerase/dehydratase family protein, partial [Methylomagnum sp.]
ARALSQLGIHPKRGDLDAPDTLTCLPSSETIVYHFAPPPPTGHGDPRTLALLAALDTATPPARLVYISTSGVYGDCQGEWVNEDRPPNPQSDRSRRRLDTEQQITQWGEQRGVPCVILRVPGIYGPGRLPCERLRQGLPVLRDEEARYSNRIHADDLAAACFAAARRGQPGGVYNVSDGQPTTMSDYFNRVADLLGLPRPPAVGLAEARRVLSPSMMSFLEESKRLDNRRMLEALGVNLRYPNLASGLAACVAADSETP